MIWIFSGSMEAISGEVGWVFVGMGLPDLHIYGHRRKFSNTPKLGWLGGEAEDLQGLRPQKGSLRSLFNCFAR
jgi:hypothetical protein